MSSDEDEVIFIDLDEESYSDDGSSKRRRRNRSRVSLDLVESDDESGEERARKKRHGSQNSKGKSGKRSAKRKRQNLFESDDESTKKRGHKNHKRSSDSDYEPSEKRVEKKSKIALDSDEDSSKKSTRKKHEGSGSCDDQKKKKPKNTATESDSLDSNKGKIRNFSVVVSKAIVPRKRMKKTAMRERVTVDETDEAADSTDTPSFDENQGLDSDSEKPKCSSAEKEPLLQKEADNGMEIDNCDSSPDSKDDGLDSDSEKAKTQSKEEAPVRKGSPQNDADMDEPNADEGVPDEGSSQPNSNDKDCDLNLEKPNGSLEEDSTNAAPKTRTDDAPSKDKVRENKRSVDESDEDFMTAPKRSSFELGYRAKEVLGLTDYGPGGVKFLIQFHGQKGAELVPNNKCRKYCPQLILSFYEKHITWSKTSKQ